MRSCAILFDLKQYALWLLIKNSQEDQFTRDSQREKLQRITKSNWTFSFNLSAIRPLIKIIVLYTHRLGGKLQELECRQMSLQIPQQDYSPMLKSFFQANF